MPEWKKENNLPTISGMLLQVWWNILIGQDAERAGVTDAIRVFFFFS
ncbi:MAG: hypothetical protein JW840_03000 [Candidatus Thermoplasmatota archaeon]|nr:hypothetical protein [Candidatus Thermoplasmatota archaeon]